MASSEHASSDLAVHVWHQLAEDGKPTVYREHEGGGTKETTVGVRDVEEAGDLDAAASKASHGRSEQVKGLVDGVERSEPQKERGSTLGGFSSHLSSVVLIALRVRAKRRV